MLCVWIHKIGAESKVKLLLFCPSVRLAGVVYLHSVPGKWMKAIGVARPLPGTRRKGGGVIRTAKEGVVPVQRLITARANELHAHL